MTAKYVISHKASGNFESKVKLIQPVANKAGERGLSRDSEIAEACTFLKNNNKRNTKIRLARTEKYLCFPCF